MEKETTTTIINKNPDSIEIGNSKTGTVKIYFDADKPAEAKVKLDCAIRLLLDSRAKVLGE